MSSSLSVINALLHEKQRVVFDTHPYYLATYDVVLYVKIF